MYENLVQQIVGGQFGADGDIAEAVERDKQRQKLKREIVVLEKKLLREKRFNK